MCSGKKHHVLIRSDEPEAITPGTVLNQYTQQILYRRKEIAELTHINTQIASLKKQCSIGALVQCRSQIYVGTTP